jgi:hypothetical protein
MFWSISKDFLLRFKEWDDDPKSSNEIQRVTWTKGRAGDLGVKVRALNSLVITELTYGGRYYGVEEGGFQRLQNALENDQNKKVDAFSSMFVDLTYASVRGVANPWNQEMSAGGDTGLTYKQADMSALLGRLDEMGRLSAGNCVNCGEAPTKLEGFMDPIVDAGRAVRNAYNMNVRISAGFVADKCAEVLAVCGDRLDAIEELETSGAILDAIQGSTWHWHRMETESVKRQMERMQKALRLAHRVANEMRKQYDNEHRHQVYRQYRSVGFVAWLEKFIPIRKAVQRLFPKHVITEAGNLRDEMKKMTNKGGEYATDALAVALAAYVHAMRKYRMQKSEEWRIGYSEQELKDDFDEVATVADRLEAVLAVCGNELDGIKDVRMRVTRWAKALRNAETSDKQQAGQINTVRLVVWVENMEKSIYQDLVALVQTWYKKKYSDWTLYMIVDSMAKSSDALRRALATFFLARERYKKIHEGDFMREFSEDEERLAKIGVANLDKTIT